MSLNGTQKRLAVRAILQRVRRTGIECLVRSGLTSCWPKITGRRHLIVTFHRIRPANQRIDPFDTCPSHTLPVFRAILEFLKSEFQLVELKELVDRRKQAAPLAAITFDDGWRDNYTLAFPVLRELDARATIFVTTGKIGSSTPFWQQQLGAAFREADSGNEHAAMRLRTIAGLTPEKHLDQSSYRQLVRAWKRLSLAKIEEHIADVDVPSTPVNGVSPCFLREAEIQEMAAGGIRFGSHTVNHIVLASANDDEIETELNDCKSQLGAIVRREIDVLAYPNGSVSRSAMKIAARVGYRIGCTTEPGRVGARNNLLCLPRVEPAWDVLKDDAIFDRNQFHWASR